MKIMKGIDPDVLVVQEMYKAEGMEEFRQSVLQQVRPDRYAYAPFNDGPDSDNGLFYDSTRTTLNGTTYLPTDLRDIAIYSLISRVTGDTVNILSMHLKAGTLDTDKVSRLNEALVVRNVIEQFGRNENIVLAGDLNVYASTDAPYDTLLFNSSFPDDRMLYDPVNAPGKWHSDSSFARFHTQSTHIRQYGGFIGGGMDDRFDFILANRAMLNHYDHESYTVYGNDGKHFNDSINQIPNGAVSDEIAQALYDGSDHLPVYADFAFFLLDVKGDRNRSELQVFVSPLLAKDEITFNLVLPTEGTVKISMFDGQGKLVAEESMRMGSGVQKIRLGTEELTNGVYMYRVEAGDGVKEGKAIINR